MKAESRNAIRHLISRLLPGKEVNVTIEALPKNSGHDVFELDDDNGHIIVKGSSGTAIAAGLNRYFRHYCNIQMSWCGDHLELPDPLPEVVVPEKHTTPYSYRYYFNICTFGYSTVWWNWERWQREIDFMALNGFNMPLAFTGQEAIWQKVYRDLGLSDQEIMEAFPGPAFLPWHWMGNIDRWGGPLPKDWIDNARQLQKKILERERSLGMTPILPAFNGHIPLAVKQRYPDSKIFKLEGWGKGRLGFSGTYVLDPQDPLFHQIATAFIEEQNRQYGTDHYYGADIFNEMTPPSRETEYLKSISRAVYEGMADADPQAIWVMQGWLFLSDTEYWTTPRIEGLLSAIPDDRMIMLDLHCDIEPQWKDDRVNAFCGKPWIWCMLHDMGCTRGMRGSLADIAREPVEALDHPGKGRLSGLGLAMEGIEHDPIVVDLFSEVMWCNNVLDVDSWVVNYVTRRYGKSIAKMNQAWAILQDTYYGAKPKNAHCTCSLASRPPNICCGQEIKPDLDRIQQVLPKTALAMKLFLECSGELRDRDTYLYDVVDLTRQILIDVSEILIHQATEAFKGKDIETFKVAGIRICQIIIDLDALMGTRKESMLGTWIESAKAWASNRDEENLLEWNARTQITLWSPKNGELNDYAQKQWSGLLEDFYYHRWKEYLNRLEQALVDNKVFDQDKFVNDISEWEEQWTRKTNGYPTSPIGDSLIVSKKIFKKYSSLIRESGAIGILL